MAERTLQLSPTVAKRTSFGETFPCYGNERLRGTVFNYRSRLIPSATTADWIDRGRPLNHSVILGATMDLRHGMHRSIAYTVPIYRPFPHGWPEHAFRDAVSTYTRFLTFPFVRHSKATENIRVALQRESTLPTFLPRKENNPARYATENLEPRRVIAGNPLTLLRARLKIAIPLFGLYERKRKYQRFISGVRSGSFRRISRLSFVRNFYQDYNYARTRGEVWDSFCFFFFRTVSQNSRPERAREKSRQ